MSYSLDNDEGLGANYAAPTSTLRNFLAAQHVVNTFGTRAQTSPVSGGYTPQVPLIRPTTTPTTFRQVAPSTPVLIAPRPTVSTVAKPTTTFRPVIPAPTPAQGQPAGSAGIMPVLKLPPVAQEGSTDGASSAFSFTKSPLLLIGAGLAALFFLNRDRR